MEKDYYENLIYPEARYKTTTLEEGVDPKSYVGTIVHVIPKDFEILTIRVEGNNFEGIIPIEEWSIYPLIQDEDSFTPKHVSSYIKKGYPITATITAYNEMTNTFFLSRKDSMEKALQYLNDYVSAETIIDSFKLSTKATYAILDIGAGITAILPRYEISDCLIKDVWKYFIGIYSIPVLLIQKSNFEDNKFVASYKKAFPKKLLRLGNIVEGRVVQFTPEKDGVFVELTPRQSGIMDIPAGLYVSETDQKADIIIGQKYLFVITKIKPPREGSHRGKRYSLKLY